MATHETLANLGYNKNEIDIITGVNGVAAEFSDELPLADVPGVAPGHIEAWNAVWASLSPNQRSYLTRSIRMAEFNGCATVGDVRRELEPDSRLKMLRMLYWAFQGSSDDAIEERHV